MRSLIKKIAFALLGLLSPEELWGRYQTIKNERLRGLIWQYLRNNERALPEETRREFSHAKWESDWFFSSWFNKAISVDHMEARRRAITHAIRLCEENPHLRFIDDIGCCSGSLSAELAGLIPDSVSVRGWEFSDRAVSELNSRFSDIPRLSFFKTDLDRLKTSSLQSIIVTIGTLQYMTESELADFLRTFDSATLIIADISNCPMDDAESTYRNHDTYNHGYKHKLEKAGYSVSCAERFSFFNNVTWNILIAAK